MTQEVKILIGIGVITVLLVGGVSIFFGNSSTSTNSKAPVDTKTLIRSDSQSISTSSAKVTIVEFADFQCPACGAFHPELKQIMGEFAGRVNLVFRNFPLPQHQNAKLAAQAAEAAGVQGKFWQMHDKLYENQAAWSESTDAKSIFVNYAGDLGLDKVKFTTDLNSGNFDAKIQRDVSDGTGLGVNSTPTIFIDNQKLDTIPGFSELKTLIEAKLK